MRSPWQTLRDGGLPLAAERSGVAPSVDELSAALVAAVAEQPAGRDGEALAAFVFAWHQHWPGEFRDAFGDGGSRLLAWAGQQLTDDGRYLKLRRLAIANLAHVL